MRYGWHAVPLAAISLQLHCDGENILGPQRLCFPCTARSAPCGRASSGIRCGADSRRGKSPAHGVETQRSDETMSGGPRCQPTTCGGENMDRIMDRDAGAGECIPATISSDIASVRAFGNVATCHWGWFPADPATRERGVVRACVEPMMSRVPRMLQVCCASFVEPVPCAMQARELGAETGKAGATRSGRSPTPRHHRTCRRRIDAPRITFSHTTSCPAHLARPQSQSICATCHVPFFSAHVPCYVHERRGPDRLRPSRSHVNEDRHALVAFQFIGCHSLGLVLKPKDLLR